MSSAVWHPVASLTLAFSHEAHAANPLRFVMIWVIVWCYQEAEKVHKVQFTKSEITTWRFWTLKEITVNTLWLYLLGKLQFGAVCALFGLQAHQVGNRRVQEVEERGWQDGNIDVLPLERKQQGGDALSHRHQPLVVCEKERRAVQALLSSTVLYERRRWTWRSQADQQKVMLFNLSIISQTYRTDLIDAVWPLILRYSFQFTQTLIPFNRKVWGFSNSTEIRQLKVKNLSIDVKQMHF